MSTPSTLVAGAAPKDGPHATEDEVVAGLDAGHLTSTAAIGLAIASFFPAVNLASAPVFVMTYAGNGAWLVTVVAAIAVICVGLCVIEFAKRYVVSGALYSYITYVFGDWARIVVAASLAIGYVVALFTVVLAFGLYAGSFLVTIGIEAGVDVGVQIVLYAIAVTISAAIAYRGLDASVRVTVALMVISVPIIVLIMIGVLFDTGLQLGDQLSLEGVTMNGFSQGLAVGVAFLILFESCTAIAAETRDPKRVVPRVVMSIPLVIGGSIIIATLIQVPALMGASEELAAGVSPPAALARGAGLGFLADIVDLVLAVSTFAALIGFLNFASRIWATMAQDGMLPRAIRRVHPRFRTPSVAILTIAGLAFVAPVILLIVTGDTPLLVYSYAATLLTYFWVLPYVLICAAAVILLRRARSLNPVVAVSAAIGIVAFVWTYLNGIINPGPSPIDVMPYVFLAALVVGIIGFAAASRRARAGASA